MKRSDNIFFSIILVLPFVISNLRMLPTIPGYQYFSFGWLLPKEALMGALFLLIVVFYVRYGIRSTTLLPVSRVAVLILFAAAAGFVFGSSFVDVVQGLSIVLAPLLLYSAIMGIRNLSFTVEKTINFFVIVGAANCLVAAIIVAMYGIGSQDAYLANGTWINKQDIVNGFLSDSHQFTVYLLFVALILLWKYRQTRRKIWLAAMASSFVAALFGFNEKAVFLLIGLSLTVWIARNLRKNFGRVLSVILFAAVSLSYVFDQAARFDNRIGLFLNMQFEELPVVATMVDTWDFFADNPRYALLGTGFGNYGSPVAVSRTAREGIVPPLARNRHESALLTLAVPDLELDEFRVFSFLQIPLKTFTTFLVEMGLVAGFIYYSFFGKLIVHHVRNSKTYPMVGNLHLLMGFYLVFLVLYSFLSIYGSFDDNVVMFPPIIIGALLDRAHRNARVLPGEMSVTPEFSTSPSQV